MHPVPRHVPGGRVSLPPPRPARLDTFLSTDVLFAFLPVYCSAAIQRLLCGRKGKRGTKARNQPHGREMVMRAREGKRRWSPRLCRRRSVCRRLGLRAAPGERAGAGVQQPSRERSEPPWALPAERPSGIRGEPPMRTRDVKLRVIEGSGSCVCPGWGVGTARFVPLLCTGADPPHTCAPETQPGEGALPPPRGLQPEPPTRSRSSKVWMRGPRTAVTATLSPAPELPFAGMTTERGVLSACPGRLQPVQSQPREWTAAAMQGWRDRRPLRRLADRGGSRSGKTLGAAPGRQPASPEPSMGGSARVVWGPCAECHREMLTGTGDRD